MDQKFNMYTLVIVENDKNMVQNIQKHIPFQKLNIQLLDCAYNGVDGLKLIEATHPDIVMSDISMPLMNGIEMLKYLNSINQNIKFVFLTGHASFEYAQTAISYGVIEYILKPAFPPDIIRALKKAVQILDFEHHVYEESSPSDSTKTDKSNPIITKMKKYAIENYSNVSLEILSSHLELSANHLRDLFKSETGMSFKKYILEIRMNKAKELIESGNYKIYEIASKVGYKDVKHFREIFKEFFGVVPREL